MKASLFPAGLFLLLGAGCQPPAAPPAPTAPPVQTPPPAATSTESETPSAAVETDSDRATDADQSAVRDLVRKYIQQQEQPEAEGGQDALPGDLRKVMALEYTVLLAKGTTEEAVDPHAYNFQLGDRVRVQIEPLSNVFIYIFHEGTSGKRSCLLPADDETPPLAKRGETLKLPNDGYFEFEPPAGEERMIVVATEAPVEKTVLSTLVFKRPGEKLSPEEEELQPKLKGQIPKTLKSIREQTSGTRFRGMFSNELLSEVGEKLKDEGTTRAVLEEPPHGKQRSTFTMSVSPDKEGASELFVSIPLKSSARGK